MALEEPKPGVRGNRMFLGAYVPFETYDKFEEIRGEVAKSKVITRAINQFIERELVKQQQQASGVASNNKK